MTTAACICDPDECDVTDAANECFQANCQHCFDQRPDIEIVTIWKTGDPGPAADVINAYLAATKES
jgi:hypothetical protein